MNPPAKVTASIVTYRSAEVIGSCLDHLLASTYPPSEIVVLDNASDDDTLARLASYIDRIQIIATGQNLGFGQGHNLVLASAIGDYFLILNPDLELPTDGLQKLVDYLETHPACGAVAPGLDETFSSGPAGFSTKYPGQRYAPRRFSQLPGTCAYLQGACVLIRAQLYRDIGGFDPRYFLYAEDLDLSLEVRLRGYELGFLPELRVRHLGGHSEQGRGSRSVARRKYAGLILFYRKHYPALTAGFLLLRDWLKFTFRLVLLQITGRAGSEKGAEYRGRLDAWYAFAWRRQPQAPR